jgi:hypothetical protein
LADVSRDQWPVALLNSGDVQVIAGELYFTDVSEDGVWLRPLLVSGADRQLATPEGFLGRARDIVFDDGRWISYWYDATSALWLGVWDGPAPPSLLHDAPTESESAER